MADLLPRIAGLVSGEDVSGLGDRRLPTSGDRKQDKFSLGRLGDARTYVFNEPVGTNLHIGMNSQNHAQFTFSDAQGFRQLEGGGDEGLFHGFDALKSDDPMHSKEFPHGKFLSVVTKRPGIFVLSIFPQLGQGSQDFNIGSSHRLALYHDPDDGVSVSAGQPVFGAADYSGDLDQFKLTLSQGDIVTITVDSMNMNPEVQVHFLGDAGNPLVSDDNSGGGIRGGNARATFQAPYTGDYVILVFSARLGEQGGYILNVE